MAQTREGNHSQRVIRASEIGQYQYCARAWWLSSVKGVSSANIQELTQGEAAHRRHGRRVWAAGFLRTLAIVLAILAIAVILLAVLH
ncbi:MAG: hypothetical protein M1434_06065 [Chloroflexi bacterium]|nr:hypothetical protein [Chloroflexota bacterium]MCL5274299.1 hypothetical protein [Chloroflexota bacterium]